MVTKGNKTLGDEHTIVFPDLLLRRNFNIMDYLKLPAKFFSYNCLRQFF